MMHPSTQEESHRKNEGDATVMQRNMLWRTLLLLMMMMLLCRVSPCIFDRKQARSRSRVDDCCDRAARLTTTNHHHRCHRRNLYENFLCWWGNPSARPKQKHRKKEQAQENAFPPARWMITKNEHISTSTSSNCMTSLEISHDRSHLSCRRRNDISTKHMFIQVGLQSTNAEY